MHKNGQLLNLLPMLMMIKERIYEILPKIFSDKVSETTVAFVVTIAAPVDNRRLLPKSVSLNKEKS